MYQMDDVMAEISYFENSEMISTSEWRKYYVLGSTLGARSSPMDLSDIGDFEGTLTFPSDLTPGSYYELQFSAEINYKIPEDSLYDEPIPIVNANASIIGDALSTTPTQDSDFNNVFGNTPKELRFMYGYNLEFNSWLSAILQGLNFEP